METKIPLCIAVAAVLLMNLNCAPDGGDGNVNVNENVNENANENQNLNDNVTDNDNVADNDNQSPPDRSLANFETDNFSGSGRCELCHSGLTDGAGEDVSMPGQWRSTMMANAAKDPYFLAKVSSEIKRRPGLQAVIEQTCATCHMPMAVTQAQAAGAEIKMFGDGFLNPDNVFHEAALDGVSCTVCHQIQDQDLGLAESFSGGFRIDTETRSPDRLLYGPFEDVEQASMQGSVGYLPVFGEHIQDAGLCATCHTLFTPIIDQNGQVVGQFPEQTPYLEWQHSEFGDGVEPDTTCQGCHMPAADGPLPIASIPAGLDPLSPFAQHHFVGGNTFMLKVFRDQIDDLGLTADEEHFDATVARALNQLENNTGTITIENATLAGSNLLVDVAVSNLAGHKLPTGFPARRAWIQLTVTDSTGAVVFESGTAMQNGTILGNDADERADAFEPHYDRITTAQQVQIYEAIMQTAAGAVTYTLLDAAAYVKDNRLLPRGFDKLTAGEAFASHGAAVGDADFVGGADVLTYEIDTAAATAPLTVDAILLYQSIAFRFAEDLRGDDNEYIEAFIALFDAADKSPVQIAADQLLVDAQ